MMLLSQALVCFKNAPPYSRIVSVSAARSAKPCAPEDMIWLPSLLSTLWLLCSMAKDGHNLSFSLDAMRVVYDLWTERKCARSHSAVWYGDRRTKHEHGLIMHELDRERDSMASRWCPQHALRWVPCASGWNSTRRCSVSFSVYTMI